MASQKRNLKRRQKYQTAYDIKVSKFCLIEITESEFFLEAEKKTLAHEIELAFKEHSIPNFIVRFTFKLLCINHGLSYDVYDLMYMTCKLLYACLFLCLLKHLEAFKFASSSLLIRSSF